MRVLNSQSLALPAFTVLKLIAFVGCVLFAVSTTMVRADTQSKKITAILAKADSAYGEYLSGQCVTCHHSKGKADGIPAIVGLPDVYIVQTILEYKHAREERTNPTMVNIAKNLSDEEIGSLAKFFSAQEAE